MAETTESLAFPEMELSEDMPLYYTTTHDSIVPRAREPLLTVLSACFAVGGAV